MDKPEQWGKIKEIVGAALERDPSERPAFLNAACGADKVLRAEVDSLLSAHAGADGLSESALTQTFADAAQVSKSVGPYRLVQKLGEGGMGQVWLAEQTAPVRRKVAVKLIKSGVYDDSVLRRFQSERQSLAIMDHPAIAKVFDAGTTPDGHPYFVMEYVPGVAITDYCDRNKLKIRARLELFLRACEGVQHAHQKAIIHRDLKPANILVVEVDGRPVPRIIDFGLAKPVTPFVSGETMNTRVGAFVGTPGYMSPEQTDPGVEDVDTRTDVYSLGVVLYELLTGFLPFDPERLKKMKLEEVLRHLREEDPPSPSTKVSADRKTSSSRAEARGTEPKQLSSLLRGDLDWIAMKALEKERNRRYGTPSELAADIARYLNNEPVAARPASPGYRLRKYVRRHRIGVAVAAGLVLLLVGFAALQALQLHRITRERDRADRIAQFMTDMFQISDPSAARGNSVTAREILDKASKDIDTGLSLDPETQAKMMDVMGVVYDNLGLYSRAEALSQRSLEILRKTSGLQNFESMRAVNNLGNILYDEGRYPECEKLYREAYLYFLRSLGREHLQTVKCSGNLANALFEQGRYAEAEKLYRDNLDIARRVYGPEHRQTIIQMGNLVNALTEQGRHAEAETLCREVLEARRRTLGPEHQETLRSMNDLGETLFLEGKYSAAEKLGLETLELRRRLLGPQHPETLLSMYNLAAAVRQQGRFAEAEKIYRDTLDQQRNVLGAESPDTLRSTAELATTLTEEGQYAPAEKLLGEAFEMQQRVDGREHPDTLKSMNNLAWTMRLAGRYGEAEKLSRQAWESEKRVLGPENPQTLAAMNNLASAVRAQGRYPEAEKLSNDALAIQRRVLAPDHPGTATAIYNVACIAALQGRGDQALTLLREAVEHGLSPAEDLRIGSDPDLKALHGDPGFEALVTDARKRAAAAKAR